MDIHVKTEIHTLNVSGRALGLYVYSIQQATLTQCKQETSLVIS